MNKTLELNQNIQEEFWQAEVLGQIYDTTFGEMMQWIEDGSLTPDDRVKRGNLRWIEARKVPMLMPFFNAKENNLPMPGVQSRNSKVSQAEMASIDAANTQKCGVHPEEVSVFNCDICGYTSCENCFPNRNSSENMCPMCGAVCQTVATKKIVSTDFHPYAAANIDVKPVISPHTNQTAIKNQNIRFPSDLVVSEPKKGIGIIFIILISLLVSGIVAYLWAYQFASPNTTAEDTLPEIVALDEKFKAEQEREEKASGEAAAKRRSEEALKKANENFASGGFTSECTNGGGQKIKCNEALQKITKQMSKNFNPVQPPAIAYDPQMPDQASALQSFVKGRMSSHNNERTKIIENYRTANSKRSFIAAFLLSFIGIFAGLFAIRSFTK